MHESSVLVGEKNSVMWRPCSGPRKICHCHCRHHCPHLGLTTGPTTGPTTGGPTTELSTNKASSVAPPLPPPSLGALLKVEKTLFLPSQPPLLQPLQAQPLPSQPFFTLAATISAATTTTVILSQPVPRCKDQKDVSDVSLPAIFYKAGPFLPREERERQQT